MSDLQTLITVAVLEAATLIVGYSHYLTFGREQS